MEPMDTRTGKRTSRPEVALAVGLLLFAAVATALAIAAVIVMAGLGAYAAVLWLRLRGEY